jgi:hypothetical protein
VKSHEYHNAVRDPWLEYATPLVSICDCGHDVDAHFNGTDIVGCSKCFCQEFVKREVFNPCADCGHSELDHWRDQMYCQERKDDGSRCGCLRYRHKDLS